MYDHKADKSDQNKWKNVKSLKKVNLGELPGYIELNLSKFKKWLD